MLVRIKAFLIVKITSILRNILYNSLIFLYLHFFAVPSTPPQSFNASPSSPTSAIITWLPPPGDDQNGVIISYVINVTVVGTGATFQLTSTTTTLSVSNLDPYTTFICIIAAVTTVGTGPFSSQFTLSTPEDGA